MSAGQNAEIELSEPTCDCGRTDRIDGHVFEGGCDAWEPDMAEPTTETDLTECDQCDGTGDRYGRAYPIAGCGTPCIRCKGSGRLNRPGELT